MTKTILVVDDEKTIREVLRQYLEREGFKVLEAGDGYTVFDILEENDPDLILLDLMLPGIDGLTITRQIRQKRNIPIIMLTAKGETTDRVRGLDIGADDYVVKPFSPQEVVSRVHAVLRRMDTKETPTGNPINNDWLKMDPNSRTVNSYKNELALTAKEFDMLWLFANHPNRVFSRSQLLDKIWGEDFFGDPSTVTVHIRRLREKMEPDPANPTHLLTVWGIGYKFEE